MKKYAILGIEIGEKWIELAERYLRIDHLEFYGGEPNTTYHIYHDAKEPFDLDEQMKRHGVVRGSAGRPR